MNLVANYGNVQIFEHFRGHYFYSVIHTSLQGSRPKDHIQMLINDDNIEEIMYINPNKPIKIYHSKYGMCNTNIKIDEHDAQEIISDAAIHNNRLINTKQPMLDAVLPDGSRINATIPPASIDGSTFTIRRFRQRVLTVIDLIRNNNISVDAAAFLWTCIEGLNAKPANIIFAGGTGSGKTTNLNSLAMFIPFDSRIITIEDTAELHLPHEHVVRLTIIPNSGVGMKELLINTLRMRPDRIILGEVRGEEAKSLFTAMNTGHEGCMGTLHANTSKESLVRITEEPMSVPPAMISGLDLIVMQQRKISGKIHSRNITEISEISEAGKDIPKINILFRWNSSKNVCEKTGVPSRLREKISQAAGITPKQFDDIVLRRKQLLLDAVANNMDNVGFSRMVINNSN